MEIGQILPPISNTATKSAMRIYGTLYKYVTRGSLKSYCCSTTNVDTLRPYIFS